ncbi:hypothetical protein [Streptomyces sp. NPDC091215]|uniref:hypothetical protein n=1 Tax=Streptomyces sp. NPDC091215 TaxID=3155192 RepID=UPI00341DD648
MARGEVTSDAKPLWLDTEEQATWLAFTSVMVRLPAALDAQLQRDAGISHFEYQALAGLSMTPERTLRMSELADCAVGSLSRLSHKVKRRGRAGSGACPRTCSPSGTNATAAAEYSSTGTWR